LDSRALAPGVELAKDVHLLISPIRRIAIKPDVSAEQEFVELLWVTRPSGWRVVIVHALRREDAKIRKCCFDCRAWKVIGVLNVRGGVLGPLTPEEARDTVIGERQEAE